MVNDVILPWQALVNARGSDGQGGGIETFTTSGDSLPPGPFARLAGSQERPRRAHAAMAHR
jgi:hypothetical protein